MRLKAAFTRVEDVEKTEIQGAVHIIDYRERRFHARDVYLTQDTSRMRTVSVKYGRKKRGYEKS